MYITRGPFAYNTSQELHDLIENRWLNFDDPERKIKYNLDYIEKLIFEFTESKDLNIAQNIISAIYKMHPDYIKHASKYCRELIHYQITSGICNTISANQSFCNNLNNIQKIGVELYPLYSKFVNFSRPSSNNLILEIVGRYWTNLELESRNINYSSDDINNIMSMLHSNDPNSSKLALTLIYGMHPKYIKGIYGNQKYISYIDRFIIDDDQPEHIKLGAFFYPIAKKPYKTSLIYVNDFKQYMPIFVK